MSNIFVREPNALRGIMAQAARYLGRWQLPHPVSDLALGLLYSQKARRRCG